MHYSSTQSKVSSNHMIIPTSEFDSLFTDDGVPFGEKMRDYIAREFADMLGPNVTLLTSDDGLEELRNIYLPDSDPRVWQSKAA